jgi:hypothetical protein
MKEFKTKTIYVIEVEGEPSYSTFDFNVVLDLESTLKQKGYNVKIRNVMHIDPIESEEFLQETPDFFESH